MHVTEYAQHYQTKVNVHEYPSGKRITNYVNYGKIVDATCPTNKPINVKATFRIKKKIDEMGDQLLLSPIIAIQKYAQSKPHRDHRTSKATWSTQSQTFCSLLEPPKSEKKYLTGSKINSRILQATASLVHPDLTKDKFSRFSLHLGKSMGANSAGQSGHVGIGMSPEFIQF